MTVVRSVSAQDFTSTAIDEGLREACGADPGRFCEWVFDQTGNETLSSLASWIVGAPLRILLIVVIAFVVARVLRRAIARFGERLTREDRTSTLQSLRRGRAGRLLVDERDQQRAAARAETLTSVLSSASGLVVWGIAGLLVLAELGISLGPLIAGAGIVGIALGFGAQSIVRDFLTGFFMLVEDQYGVGDVVNLGEVSGVVERVTLRTTVLRDVTGNVWHVPNGEIHRICNMSQIWSRAVLDVDVAYDTDLDLAQGVIQRVADELWQDEGFTGGEIIDPPEVWGVENMGADGISIRLVVKTDPAEQWIVARELRLRIKKAFDQAGIEIPFPQRTLWFNEDQRGAKPDPATVPVAPIRRRAADEVLPDPEAR